MKKRIVLVDELEAKKLIGILLILAHQVKYFDIILRCPCALLYYLDRNRSNLSKREHFILIFQNSVHLRPSLK